MLKVCIQERTLLVRTVTELFSPTPLGTFEQLYESILDPTIPFRNPPVRIGVERHGRVSHGDDIQRGGSLGARKSPKPCVYRCLQDNSASWQFRTCRFITPPCIVPLFVRCNSLFTVIDSCVLICVFGKVRMDSTLPLLDVVLHPFDHYPHTWRIVICEWSDLFNTKKGVTDGGKIEKNSSHLRRGFDILLHLLVSHHTDTPFFIPPTSHFICWTTLMFTQRPNTSTLSHICHIITNLVWKRRSIVKCFYYEEIKRELKRILYMGVGVMRDECLIWGIYTVYTQTLGRLHRNLGTLFLSVKKKGPIAKIKRAQVLVLVLVLD